MYKRILIFILSICFIIAGNPRMSGKKSGLGMSKTGKGSITYISVANELLDSKNLKKTLSRNEKQTIEDFKRKKKFNGLAESMAARNLESAIKKHKCYVPLNRKKSNLNSIPGHNDKADWFKLDCSKTSKSSKKSSKSRTGRTNPSSK